MYDDVMPKYKCIGQCKNIITKDIARHEIVSFCAIGVQVVLTCEPKILGCWSGIIYNILYCL